MTQLSPLARTQLRALLDLLTPTQRTDLLAKATAGKMTFDTMWSEKLGCGCAIGEAVLLKNDVRPNSSQFHSITDRIRAIIASGEDWHGGTIRMEEQLRLAEIAHVRLQQSTPEMNVAYERGRAEACALFATEIGNLIDEHGEFLEQQS